MPLKLGAFLMMTAREKFSGQQARAGKLRDARHRGDARGDVTGFARGKQKPATPGQARHQFAKHGRAHPIDHDEQHRALGRQRRHDHIQNPFDGNHIARIAAILEPAGQEAGKTTGILVECGVHP